MIEPPAWVIAFAALPSLAGAGLLIAYATGEPNAAGWLCRAGLPNTSVPSRFREQLHGERCQIYGKKIRISGILWWDGFEVSGFFPGRFAEDSFLRRGIEWPGISLLSDGGSDSQGLVEQFRKGPMGGGRALVTLEGWPSVGSGRFGHLGAHDQQILVDRIIAASPPPEPLPADYRRWRRLQEEQMER